jgi:serine/threonine protein kinase
VRFLSDAALDRLARGVADPGGSASNGDGEGLDGVILGGRFEIDARVGEGGMATAHRALDRQSGELVVVKVTRASIVRESEPGAALSVLKEAMALGLLDERTPRTPHVIRLIAYGAQTIGELELPWLALELVDGGAYGTTLEQRVAHLARATGHAFDSKRVARVIEQLAAGLDAVHQVGVVHRDVKPANALIQGDPGDELAKLADFGIARPDGAEATFQGLAIGTPGYAPPELCALDTAAMGPATDVFGLAATAFYALTAEPLFDVDGVAEALRATRAPRRSVTAAPMLDPKLAANADVCRAIDALIARATHEDPTRRCSTPGEFARSLTALINTLTPEIAPESAPTAWSQLEPGDPLRAIDAAVWDGAAWLAIERQRLLVWDGAWRRASGLRAPKLHAITLEQPALDEGVEVRELRALACGESASIVVLERAMVASVLFGEPSSARFVALAGALDDLLVLASAGEGGHVALHALVGRYWLAPLALPQFARVTALRRVGRARFLVEGRDPESAPLACHYAPLEASIQLVPAQIPSNPRFVAEHVTPARHLGLTREGAVLEGRIGPANAESPRGQGPANAESPRGQGPANAESPRGQGPANAESPPGQGPLGLSRRDATGPRN